MKAWRVFGALGIVAIAIVIVTASKPQTSQQVAPTPTPSRMAESQSEKRCVEKRTPPQIEGPYYKTGSPQRTNIAQGFTGEKLTVTGLVLDEDCNPVTNARLDFWQADSKGVYDNSGYTLREHQYTDKDGKYILETIVPAAYENRPPHIHVKVAVDGRLLTTQLYFPGEAKNQTDALFNPKLLMEISSGPDGKTATFTFVL